MAVHVDPSPGVKAVQSAVSLRRALTHASSTAVTPRKPAVTSAHAEPPVQADATVNPPSTVSTLVTASMMVVTGTLAIVESTASAAVMTGAKSIAPVLASKAVSASSKVWMPAWSARMFVLAAVSLSNRSARSAPPSS